MIQKMESQQSTATGGIQVGRVQMVERTTYRLHTQAELVDLANQFRQRPGAPLAAWPLCLWALGVDSIACSDAAMEKLASITTYPFQCQQQQSSWRHGAGQGSHSLMERVVAAIRTAWANASDVVRYSEQVAGLYRLSASLAGVGHAPGHVQSQHTGP